MDGNSRTIPKIEQGKRDKIFPAVPSDFHTHSNILSMFMTSLTWFADFFQIDFYPAAAAA